MTMAGGAAIILLVVAALAWCWHACAKAPFADQSDERGFFLTDDEGNPLP